MGLRDRIRSAGKNLAGVAGEALLGFAGDGEFLAKADPTGLPTDEAAEDPKSLFWDPFAIIEQLGYKERPSQITYGTLKAMVWKMPIVSAIIQTRINQIAAFAQPSHDRYDLGFRIKLRESKKQPTRIEQRYIGDAERLMMHTGYTDDPRKRDGFEKFLRKLAWDTMTYDQMGFEIVPNRKGTPAAWYAIDASTLRLADTASTYMNKDSEDPVEFVQIYDGMIISEYTREELCFGVRNPRTDIRLYGYGVSELEMLISTVTALLWGMEYNQRAFSQGSVHKGILNFKGTIPERQLRSFRRHWYQMLSGVENAWRTPITNAEDLQWVSMHQNNRDMEYNAWMDFLIKVACSIFLIDPIEVNFKYGNTGQKSSMQDTHNTQKITESKERGLRPLLRFIAQCINHHIIWPMNPDFEFAFVGLDAFTRGDVADLNTKLVKTVRTIDELRAEDDLEPLPDGKGEVILDPTWMQMHTQMQAQEQAAEEGGEEEGEGEAFDFGKLLEEGEEGEPAKEEEEPTEKSMRALQRFGRSLPAHQIAQSSESRRLYLVDVEI